LHLQSSKRNVKRSLNVSSVDLACPPSEIKIAFPVNEEDIGNKAKLLHRGFDGLVNLIERHFTQSH
jgi:hypothetical protein